MYLKNPNDQCEKEYLVLVRAWTLCYIVRIFPTQFSKPDKIGRTYWLNKLKQYRTQIHPRAGVFQLVSKAKQSHSQFKPGYLFPVLLYNIYVPVYIKLDSLIVKPPSVSVCKLGSLYKVPHTHTIYTASTCKLRDYGASSGSSRSRNSQICLMTLTCYVRSYVGSARMCIQEADVKFTIHCLCLYVELLASTAGAIHTTHTILNTSYS